MTGLIISGVNRYDRILDVATKEYVNGAVLYRRGGNIKVNDGVTSGTINSSFLVQNYILRATMPDYRVKIAKKQNATNPYTRKEYVYKQPLMSSSSLRVIDGTPKTSFAVTGASVWTPTSYIPSNSETIAADDIATKRLQKRLSSNLSEFKALVPLGELKETSRLYSQVVEATNDVLKALLELKHGRPRNLVSAASKAWLTFSFGVSPTVSDLNGLFQSINDYIYRTDIVKTLYGQEERQWSSVVGAPGETSACAGFNWKHSPREQNHSYRVRYTAGVRMNLQSSNNYNIPSTFGLNFGEIIPTLWELTPFSWVVDYFTTTGDFLSDLWYSEAGNTIYVCKSVKYTCNEFIDWELRNISSAYQQTGNSLGYSEAGTSMLFQRSALAAMPHRAFRFKTASEVSANSVNRLLNLASLLLSK